MSERSRHVIGKGKAVRAATLVLGTLLLGTSVALHPGAVLSEESQTGDARKSPAGPNSASNKGGGERAYSRRPLPANLPLRFEENKGQTSKEVRFLARGAGYVLFLTQRGMVLSLHRSAAEQSVAEKTEPRNGTPSTERAAVSLELIGARQKPAVVGEDRLPGVTSYLFGNDQRNWRGGIRGFGKVRYRNVYPGTDLLFHRNGSSVEYDFLVAPGRDPRRIAFGITGASRVSIDKMGDLLIGTRLGTLRQERPVIYQIVGGKRRHVTGRFVLNGSGTAKQVRFDVGPYDRSRTLVIDPTLSFSTFLGGSSQDHGNDIAVDGDGNVYVVGQALSPDFPTTEDGFQPAIKSHDAFVAKLGPGGDELLYSTYLGGNNITRARSVVVDGSGHAYIAGQTFATDFPVTEGAYQTGHSGNAEEETTDAFLTKLDPYGENLVYSSYLGGADMDGGTGLAIDSRGHAYLTGRTASADFPTESAFQSAYGGGESDAFLTKFDPSGESLAFSTFLGGTGPENTADETVLHGDIGDVAVDGDGSPYLTGSTGSADFPTTSGAYLTSGTGGFATKFTPTGEAMDYSTLLDSAYGISIAVDSSGRAHIAGSTGKPADAFVKALNPSGSGLDFATLLAGDRTEDAQSIALGPDGGVYVAGRTDSSNFPIKHSLSDPAGSEDAFVVKLDVAGSMLYGVQFGGAGADKGQAVAVDGFGNAYVAGSTFSSGFPTKNAFQSRHGGQFDAFAAKIGAFERSGWHSAGELVQSRFGQTSTLLSNGKILVAGGCDHQQNRNTSCARHTANAELYDPETGNSSKTDPMKTARSFHSAIRLENGKVLVLGGCLVATDENCIPETLTEIYDPSDGKWTETGSLHIGRRFSSVSLLDDGRVLVAGGEIAGAPSTATSEIYDPGTGKWSLAAPMNTPRRKHSAAPLSDGRFLVSGGINVSASLSSAEIFDPSGASGPLSGSWTSAESLANARSEHTSTVLADGRVLVIGGRTESEASVATAETYDGSARQWAGAGSLELGRREHTATLLQSGKVLVAGGRTGFGDLDLALDSEVFDPDPEAATDPWSSAGESVRVRSGSVLNPHGHDAVLLPNGKVVALGGSPSKTVEVFAPIDLSVIKSDAPDPASLGGTITYTMQVANSGPGEASGVTLTDPLPPAATFVSVASSQGTCGQSSGSVRCNIGTLAPRKKATVTIVVEPNAIGKITNVASVAANQGDANASNDSASSTTTVQNDLGCTIIGTPSADSLTGTAGSDVICGLGGNDSISGLNGDDRILAGTGDDNVVAGDNGMDTVEGGTGDDVLYGGGGNDALIGGSGADRLYGGSGNDKLDGLDGVSGNDRLFGEAGQDSCTADPGDILSSCP